ncbi:MAG: hypothetical protein QXQ30_00010 [Candidatus Pacearchaeota archaeon]
MKKIIILILFIFLTNFCYAQNYYYFTPSNIYKEDYEKFFSQQALSFACNQTKNFIVYIDPLEGCQPNIIRSDLLEDQPVLVFCKIKAINLNPLLDNIYIKSVSIATPYKSSNIVGGVIYHSPYIGEKLLSRYLWDEYGYKRGIASFDNLGYAVVMLNPVPESKMPERIDINATARILYSAGFIYGIDRNSFLIPELSEEEWKARFDEFSFFNGKGFIKVNKIKKDFVDVEIYKETINDPTPIRVTLTKDKPVKVNFWGFFCDNQEFDIILEDILYPQSYARLIINGKEYLLAEGDEAEGCKIINIEKGIVSGSGEVTINCDGKTSVLKIEPLKVVIDFDNKIYELTLGEGIKIDDKNYYYLVCVKDNYAYFYEGDSTKKQEVKKLISKYFPSCEFDKEKEIKSVKVKNSIKIDSKNLTLKEIFILKDSLLPENVEKAYSEAKEKYMDIFFTYKYEKDESDGEYIGAKALYELANLAIEIGKRSEAINILSELIEEYEDKDSGIVLEARKKKISLIKYEIIGKTTIEKNGNFWDIELIDIEHPYSFDSFVELKINDKKDRYWIGQHIGEGWIIEEIKEDHIILRNLKEERIEKITLGIERCIDVKNDKCIMNVKLTNINVKKAAKITVKPPELNYVSETNFTIHIGIEKRAIKIAPEKALEMAKKLNETSKKIEEFNKKLGKVVENWKKACYIGGTALFLKNFIEGMGGESLARKIAMRGTDGKGGWTQICIEKGYKKLDECFRENEDEINNDVEAIKRLIGEVNEEIKIAEEGCKNLKNFEERERCLYEKIAEKIAEREKIKIKIDGEEIGIENFIKKSLPILSERGYFVRDQLKDFLLELKINQNENISGGMKNLISNKVKNFVISNKRLADEIETYVGEFPINIYEKKQIYVPLNTIDKLKDNIKEKLKEYRCDGPNIYYFFANYNGNLVYVIVSKEDSTIEVKCVLKKDGSDIKKDENILNNLKNYIILESKCSPIDSKYIYAGFYESGKYKDRIGYMPVIAQKGWYIFIDDKTESYYESGALKEYYLCNVGNNGVPDLALYQITNDDICIQVPADRSIIYNIKLQVCGEDIENIQLLTSKAEECVATANTQKRLGKPIQTRCGNFKIKKQVTVPTAQCEDFMSPSECRILFNLCDPVLCPPSRCNLAGRYPVDNVVQTGIIGSLVLCLPNFEGGKGVIMPICLTGLHAGIEFLNKILNETVKCLEISVETGKNIGICDQIKSIYICEMLWNQLLPFVRAGIPSILEKIERKGGGEYAKFRSTWENTFEGLRYFYQVYGVTAAEAFKIRSTQEVGTMICKKFLGVRYPNAASLLEEISKPELPYQFFAKIEEIPYTTITYPPQSHYKVLYIIYAGEQDIWYSIYLRNPPQYSGIIVQQHYIIDAGFLARGQSISKSPDFVAVSGYKEICVNINGREYCGFEVSSTSYAINFLQDKYIEDQLKANIKTAKECKSGKPSLIPTSSLLNIQQGVTKALSPAIYKQGITRICSTLNPGVGSDEENWKAVGYCDDPNIKCWVYLPSIKQAIKDLGLENETIQSIEKKSKEILEEIEKVGIGIEEEEIYKNTYNYLNEKIENYEKIIKNKKIEKEDVKRKIEKDIKDAEENITKILDPKKLKILKFKLATLYKLKTLIYYYSYYKPEEEKAEEKPIEKPKEEEKPELPKSIEVKIYTIVNGKEKDSNFNGIVNYDDNVELCTKIKIDNKWYNKETSNLPYEVNFDWYKIEPIKKIEGDYVVYGEEGKMDLVKYKQKKLGKSKWCIELPKEVGTYWYRVEVEIKDENYYLKNSSLGRPASKDDISKFEEMINKCKEKIEKQLNVEIEQEVINSLLYDIKNDSQQYLEPDAYEGCVGISTKITRISRKANDSVCPDEIKNTKRCEFIKTIYIFQTVPFGYGGEFYENDVNKNHYKNFMIIDCINLALAAETYSTNVDLYRDYTDKTSPYSGSAFAQYIIYNNITTFNGITLHNVRLKDIYSYNINFNNGNGVKTGDVLLQVKECKGIICDYTDTLILLNDTSKSKRLDAGDIIIQASSDCSYGTKIGISLCARQLSIFDRNKKFTLVKSSILDKIA